MSETILEVRNISKGFPGVKALDDFSAVFMKGETHALVGMNGSGKSTLLKIITGVYHQDVGEIILDGEIVQFHSVQDSRSVGISQVYQEMSLVPALTVSENIFLGHMPMKHGLVSYREAVRKAKSLLERLGMEIDPTVPVEELTVAEKQMVEIAKALSMDTKLLLLDEPTAVLTKIEIENLFQLIRQIKSQGITIIYISHRLEEVFEICDRVTVLRDGKLIGTEEMSSLTPQRLIEMMIGHTQQDLFPALEMGVSEQRVIDVDGLCNHKLKDISFYLRKKEILGIYGVVGSGQKELAEALFGIDANELKVKKYEVNGREVRINSPVQAVEMGLAYIPEERKLDGLMLSLDVRQNALVTFIERFAGFMGRMNGAEEKNKTKELIGRLRIKVTDDTKTVNTLSGGNQQKIVIAKWLGRSSDILLCFEPTRGIDMAAKAQVYEALEEMRRGGTSVVIISSELPEVMGMTERMYIMRKGKFIGEFKREQYDEEKIIACAAGLEARL